MSFGSKGFSFPAADPWILKAREARLHETPTWRRLLFVVPGWFHSEKSLVDDPDFFLAPNGRTSPEAELAATLRGLMDPQAKVGGLRPGHPLCSYPARRKFLQERLGIPDAAFPAVACPTLDVWQKEGRYLAVSLVFSSFYPDSPASMFGHMFLRFHRSGVKSEAQSHLNDDAANFAALPDTGNPFLYVAQGLFGGFIGRFAFAPYYMKLQEYNNLESRDLWEYEMPLSPEEQEGLLLSLWEIGPHDIDYYYFDDNCSYVMLALLETANESFRLTEKLHVWVTPSDALRVAVEGTHASDTPTFRASAQSRYLERFAALTPEEARLLASLIETGSAAPLQGASLENRRRVVDAALDYVDYQEKLGGNKTAQTFAELRQSLIAMRLAIRQPPDPYVVVPSQADPMKGHLTSRLNLGLGQIADRTRLEMEIVPALHDLLASPTGFAEGMAITFTGLTLQYDPGTERGIVRKLDWLKVQSLAVDKALLTPVSWMFALTSEQAPGCLTSDSFCSRHFMRGGAGKSLRLGERGLVYSLALAEAGYATDEAVEGVYGGVGLETGMIWRARDQVRFLIDYSVFRRSGNHVRDEAIGQVQGAVTLTSRSELRLKYSRQEGRDSYFVSHALFF